MGAETRQYGCWQFVAWSLRYGGGSNSELGSQNRICFRLQWPWSPCVANWTAQILHGPNSRCIGRKKLTRPRKVRGLRYGRAWHQVRVRARNLWAAVQLRRPHWVRGRQLRGALSGLHSPRTCPALAMHCPRNATAVPLVWTAIARQVKC